MTVAEEARPSRQCRARSIAGGLGFGFKWNMGWMNDTLEYISKGPDLSQASTITR